MTNPGTTDAATLTNSTFDLKETSTSGSAASVTSAAQLIVSVNGVIQKANTGTSAPAEGFALSDADTIVFSAAPGAGASIFIVQVGSAVSIPTPGDGTVTAAKIGAGAVIAAKIGTGAVELAKMASQSVDEDNLYISNAGSNGQFLSKQTGDAGGLTWATVSTTTDFASLTDTTVTTSDPTRTTNPSATGHLYVNKTSGEAWICTDASNNANSWANIGSGIGNIGASYSVDFLVIAGGGGGGSRGGGGGAGGYRNSYNSETSGGGGSSETALSLTPGTVYTITVGTGGTGDDFADGQNEGANGTASSIVGSDITDITTVGGGGGGNSSPHEGKDGGSGGGAGYSGHNDSGGSGTANQGYNGGAGPSGSPYPSGGGGGAGAVGVSGDVSSSQCGAGGAGLSSSITGSGVTRAGGGGGSGNGASLTDGGAGSGGGTRGNNIGSCINATDGTGSGGGGSYADKGGDGGDGIVILRIPTASYSSSVSGGPATSTDGSDTILQFTSNGTYTA
jgi:hypothetical protein